MSLWKVYKTKYLKRSRERSLIDYNLKSKVLNSGLQKEVNALQKSIFAKFYLEETGISLKCKYDYDTAIQRRCFLLSQDEKAYYEAVKINYATYKRVGRLKDRIRQILTSNSESVFVTMTFSDETLEKTSAETRRRYVTRFLKNSNAQYVSNIDFGKKNGREHYHAVIGSRVDNQEWNYGYIYSEIISNERTKLRKYDFELSEEEQAIIKEELTYSKLSKYVAKLTNHAIKETNKRSVIIYSR